MTPPPLTRRLATAAVLVGAVLAIPLLAGALAVGAPGALAAGLGAIFTFLLLLRVGPGQTRRWWPLLILALALATLTAGTVWWVALLVLLAVVAGAGASRGLLVPPALTGMLAASAPAVTAGEDPWVRVLVAALGGAYVLLIGPRLGLPSPPSTPPTPSPPPPPTPPPTASRPPSASVAPAALATVLGVVAGVAGLLALWSAGPYAYWIPTVVFLLVLPVPDVRLHHGAQQRLRGTALGVLVGMPFVLLLLRQLPWAARHRALAHQRSPGRAELRAGGGLVLELRDGQGPARPAARATDQPPGGPGSAGSCRPGPGRLALAVALTPPGRVRG